MVTDDTVDVGRTQGRSHMECQEGTLSAGTGSWGAMEGSDQGWEPWLHHWTIGEVEGRLDRLSTVLFPCP